MAGNLKHIGLVLLSGVDAPGITENLFSTLSPFQIEIVDFEQVVIRKRLLLTVLFKFDGAHEKAIEKDLLARFDETDIDIAIDFQQQDNEIEKNSNLHVVILGKIITPNSILKVAQVLKKYRSNIDRVRRTATAPITALEFDISAVYTDADISLLQRDLALVSSENQIDIAVQKGGLIRRAKKIVLLDMDSTLIQQEVIDLLAFKYGCGDKVASITESAMRGEIDFKESLKQRVSLLAGADQSLFREVLTEITLTPGAEKLIRTLHKLGHKVGVVSGGFLNVIEPILNNLKIDFFKANTLEIEDGKITGRLIGPIIDKEAKAEALREFAELENVDLSQTIAIGDGANDLGMIALAGLGIAFNAKPKVKAEADTSINHPYLDSVLFLMGISSEEIVS